jgi:hypothetical protein
MKINLVKFGDSALSVIRNDGCVAVAMKPICETIGLDWDTQRRNVASDPVLSAVTVIMTATGADGKQYEMLCLPLDYLNGWLFKINANRYKGERRELIIKYQRECYRVLAEHFLGNRASSHAASTTVSVASVSLDAMQEVINRIAASETAALVGELRSFCARHGILAHDELLFLASQAFVYHSPTAPLSAMDVHPATAARCFDRVCRNAR